MNFTLECWVCLSNGTCFVFTGAVWKNRSSASAADMNSTVLLSAGDRGGPKEHQKAKEALT